MNYLNFFGNDYLRLLIILKQHELDVNGEIIIPLSQEELAKCFCCSRQTIIKLLGELINQDYVSRLGKHKLIITEKGLDALNFLGYTTPFKA